MSIPQWKKPPVEVVQAFELRRLGRGPIGALALWATWAVESLHYLEELDQAHSANLHTPGNHHSEVIDIAHVRWATGTSITSLDLCAAVLGREYCAWTKANELDLREFDPTIPHNGSSKLRSILPGAALAWVDGVLSDARYKEVKGARNPLTHSRLIRKFVLSNPRANFVVTATGRTFAAEELVNLATVFATDHVSTFLGLLERL